MIDYFDCHPLDGYRRLTFMMLDEERGGLEPIDDVPCVVEGGPPGPLEREAVEEGNGLRSAAATAPTLAYGYLVLESGRDVLLPVLVSGWCESGGGSLGDSRVDDGSGCGVHFGASKGTVPRRAASNHLGQRSSVHREGLQDVHPHLRDDAREDRAVLPAIERKDRTLAQDDKIGCPASCQPLEPRRGSPIDGTIRRILQRGSVAQRDRHIAPLDFMAGKAPEIWSERDRKLEQAREARRERRSNKVPA